MKVFGPTEHPRLARRNVFEVEALISRFSAIASAIIDLEESATCHCKIHGHDQSSALVTWIYKIVLFENV